MTKRVLVAVAWPYANGSIHLGQLAGCYLPADIFARYHRMKGNQVLMVSGSDQHGTPITLKAERDGISPQEIVDRYHTEFLECWKRTGIDFDVFTTTGTSNHAAVACDIFKTLFEKGYIYKKTTSLPFCHTCKRFLADRYVEGTCPNCSFPNARGDQCDKCGRTLDPIDLVNIKCRLSGDTPAFKESDHLFFKLSAFQDYLIQWVKRQSHWKPNVLNYTIAYLEGGLHDRAITRDIEWGIPVPLEGFEHKKMYVWFEAVIGYLSASKEWAHLQGDENLWKEFWEGENTAYYFMGKDNIPFHTVIWPAMLMGYGGLNLPYDIPANEYLTLGEGQKLSTSRNWAIWLPDYLDRYEPDPLRYVLSANMPETSDANFTWQEYYRRNNDELVATYGNTVHRVLTMVNRNLNGVTPSPVTLDDLSISLLDKADQLFSKTADHLEHCRFRMALASAMTLARETNRYLEQRAPWKALKKDMPNASTTLWVALQVINCLKIAFYPFLPFSSEKLHGMLGFDGSVRDNGWVWKSGFLPAGQKLSAPEPLFTKLDEKIVQEEIERLVS